MGASKYRIYPTKDQEKLLTKTFGGVHFIYNAILSDKKKAYAETGKNITFTPAGYKDAHPFLKEVDSLALNNGQLQVATAYKNYLEQRALPLKFKFKVKYRSRNSYTTNFVNGNIRFEGAKIRLPKLGLVPVRRHEKAPDDWQLKSVTVSQDSVGNYYISGLYEFDHKIPAILIESIEPARILGLDFSMPELYIDSNGDKPGNPKVYRKSEKALQKAQ
jgi:putative transposase